jgi:hypothetical protein
MHAIALAALSSDDGTYCDARHVVMGATARYLGHLEQIERRIGSKSRGLSTAIRGMPPRSRGFVLRSGVVRSLINSLEGTIVDGQRRDGMFNEHAYESLTRGFESAIAVAPSEEIGAWARAGFHCSLSLTQPFPWIVALWDGIDGAKKEWNEAASLQELFAVQLAKEVGSRGCVLRPFTVGQGDQLAQALEFLREISMTIVDDVAFNLRHVCLFDDAEWTSLGDDAPRNLANSLSTERVPATCFLSPGALTSVPLLAEMIYHEALHNKLINAVASLDILREDYKEDSAPRFRCPWNQDFSYDRDDWTFDRALHAYYVWVHLLILHGIAIERNMDTPYHQARYRTAREKATALGAWLQSRSSTCLGTCGEKLLVTLSDTLNSIGKPNT